VRAGTIRLLFGILFFLGRTLSVSVLFVKPNAPLATAQEVFRLLWRSMYVTVRRTDRSSIMSAVESNDVKSKNTTPSPRHSG
jgi:hypothetical protein